MSWIESEEAWFDLKVELTMKIGYSRSLIGKMSHGIQAKSPNTQINIRDILHFKNVLNIIHYMGYKERGNVENQLKM